MSHEAHDAYEAPATPPIERTVIIEVLGGVAYVTAQPDDIDVMIIDHDNEPNEDNEIAESEVE